MFLATENVTTTWWARRGKKHFSKYQDMLNKLTAKHYRTDNRDLFFLHEQTFFKSSQWRIVKFKIAESSEISSNHVLTCTALNFMNGANDFWSICVIFICSSRFTCENDGCNGCGSYHYIKLEYRLVTQRSLQFFNWNSLIVFSCFFLFQKFCQARLWYLFLTWDISRHFITSRLAGTSVKIYFCNDRFN